MPPWAGAGSLECLQLREEGVEGWARPLEEEDGVVTLCPVGACSAVPARLNRQDRRELAQSYVNRIFAMPPPQPAGDMGQVSTGD